MKTVLQQIIEKLEINAKEICPMDIDDILIWVEENELIKEEKQHIKDAYWAGLNGCIDDYSESETMNNELVNIKYGEGAELYYNKTYKDGI